MSLSELAREDCEAEVSSTQTKTAWRSAWLLGETMFPHRRLNPTASWRNSENTQRCNASSKEERLSNMMPEAGPKMLSRPYTDGMVVAGDAAGHLLNNGYTFRGVDMAIQAGVAAAQTVLEARKKKDYSANSLKVFERKLHEDPALKDMYTFHRVPAYLRNRRLYAVYPELVCSAAEAVYRVDGTGKRKISKELRLQAKGRVSIFTLIRDLIRGARTF